MTHTIDWLLAYGQGFFLGIGVGMIFVLWGTKRAKAKKAEK